MSLFRSTSRRRPERIVEEATVTAAREMRDTAEARLLEQDARAAHVIALAEAALLKQAALHRDDRDDELVDFALEVRSALAPPAAGSRVLGVRPPVPFVPGRAR